MSEDPTLITAIDEWLPRPDYLVALFCLIWMVRSLVRTGTMRRRPEYSCLPGSGLGAVLKRCAILEERYIPTRLWGCNGHIQTAVYGWLGHKELKRVFDKRHLVVLDDGTTVTFDLFEPITRLASKNDDTPAGDYTMLLCPGIANSSESNYIRTCVHHVQERGYRCAVLNHLGAQRDLEITSSHIFSYGGTDEVLAVFEQLTSLYPRTRFILIGFSMGANIITRLLSRLDQQQRSRVMIGLSVCQGYSAVASCPAYFDWTDSRRAYNYIITENLKRLLRRHYEMAVVPHVGLVDEQSLWRASSILAVDELYSRRVHGFHSVHDYYAWCSCLSQLDQLEVPMVFLNAVDDPLIPERLCTGVRQLAGSNPDVAFVLTQHGGHLGFLEGGWVFARSVTWLDRFIGQLADAAVEVLDGRTK